MYERILVPTDGSHLASRAASHAVELAAGFDATVHAIYVLDTGLRALTRDADARLRAEQTGERATDGVVELARTHGLDAETAVLEGTPAQCILDYVEEHDVDLVVMGTHGRSGLDRYLLGSVTERVLRASPVPVVVVGPSAEATVTTDQRAIAVAREALGREGYPDATIAADPYRQSGTWVVQAEADGATFNVHVDAATGTAHVARLRERTGDE